MSTIAPPPPTRIQRTITLLNSDLVAEAAEGLAEVSKFEAPAVVDSFFETSPIAFEITRVWVESNEIIIEEHAIQALICLLTKSSDAKAKEKLGWTLLKSERLVEKLAMVLTKKDSERHIRGLHLLTAISGLQAALAREIQAKFDFRALVIKEEKKAAQTYQQKGKPVKIPDAIIQLEKRRSEAIFSLVCTTLTVGDEHARRLAMDGPLVGYCFEHLQNVVSSSVTIFCSALTSVFGHRLLLSPKCLANVARSVKVHSEESARDAAMELLKTLLSAKKDRVASRLIEYLDPIQDERHATLLEISLSLSKRDSLTQVFEQCKGLSILEPRPSFPWVQTVSLVCRLLLSCPPRGSFRTAEEAFAQILPPEPMLSRACLMRGLSSKNNLVRLYTLDLISHMLFRAEQVLRRLEGAVDRRRFSEQLTRRMPEFSVLVNIRSELQKKHGDGGNDDEKGITAEKVLYLRSVRVLELYGLTNVTCGFDVLRFVPSSTSDSCPLTIHRVLRLVLANLRSIQPDDWLKPISMMSSSTTEENVVDGDNDEETVLGSLLMILASRNLDVASTSRAEMVYLCCYALQAGGLCASPTDVSTTSSVLLSAVEDGGTCLKEMIVSSSAKELVMKAAGSLEHAKAMNLCLARLRKNKRKMDFNALLKEEWPRLGEPLKKPSLALLGSSERDVELWLDSISIADYPETVADAIGQLCKQHPRNPLVGFALKAMLSRCSQTTSRFGAMKCLRMVVESLCEGPGDSSLLIVADLSAVVNGLNAAEAPTRCNLFGVAKEVVDVMKTFVSTLFLSIETSGNSPSPSALMIIARNSMLLTSDDRRRFAQRNYETNRSDLLEIMLRVDPSLAVENSELFQMLLDASSSISSKRFILEELIQSHPSEVQMRLCECGMEAVQAWLNRAGPEEGPVLRLAMGPGIVSLLLAQSTPNAVNKEMLLGLSVQTTSAALKERLLNLLLTEADGWISHWMEEHQQVPRLVQSFLSSDDLNQDVNNGLGTVYLSFYALFKRENLASEVARQIVAITDRKRFDKTVAKTFLANSLSISDDDDDLQTDETMLDISRHLILCKRLKVTRVFPKVLSTMTSDQATLTLSQVKLLLVCMELDTAGKGLNVLSSEDCERFFFNVLKRYQGTLSLKDRCIRRIIHLCEIWSRQSAKMDDGLVLSPTRYGYAFGQFLAPFEVYSLPASSLLGSLTMKENSEPDTAQVSGEFLELIQLHYAWVTEGLDIPRLRRAIDLDRDVVPACPLRVTLNEAVTVEDLSNKEDDEGEGEEEGDNEEKTPKGPRKRSQVDGEENPDAKLSSDVYDPSYMLRILGHVLGLFAVVMDLPYDSRIANKSFDVNHDDYVEMDESNEQQEATEDLTNNTTTVILGLDAFPARKWLYNGQVDFILHCLSSRSEDIRVEAYSCLQRFAQLSSRLMNRFKERDQVLLVLKCLKSGVKSPYEQIPPLMSAYCQDFLNVVTKGASHPQFTRVNAFVFSSVESSEGGWDLSQIPIFFTTFNSGSMEFEQDRAFTMRVLCKGVQSREDLRILSKRHLIEMVLSAFTSSLSDAMLRRLILHFLERVVVVPGGGALTLLKHGFVSFCLQVFDQLAMTKTQLGGEVVAKDVEDATDLTSRPIWRMADDRGGDEEYIRENTEIAESLSGVLKSIAMARASLVDRVMERDQKRMRTGVGWFPRCEWSSEEAELVLAAPRLLELMSKASFFNRNAVVFKNLVEVLVSQKTLLRINATQIVQLIDACPTDHDLSIKRELVKLTCTAVTDLSQSQPDVIARLVKFVLEFGERHSNDQCIVISRWLVEVAKSCPRVFSSGHLNQIYLNGFVASVLKQLNAVLCAVIVQDGKKDELREHRQHVFQVVIPKLLDSPSLMHQDCLGLLLQEVVLGGDGSKTLEVVRQLKIDI